MRRLLFLPILPLLLMGCDSGDIYERDVMVQGSGRVAMLTASVSGVSQLQGNYNVALAAFADGNQYAIAQRAIPENTLDGEAIDVTLHLPPEATTVELALTNRLRKRILTLASVSVDDLGSVGDTLRIDLAALRLDREGCIRKGVFDVACIQCHGGNGHAAAGLDLTQNMPKKDRLQLILTDGGASSLHYNHTDVLSSHFRSNLDEVRQFLYEWIWNYE